MAIRLENLKSGIIAKFDNEKIEKEDIYPISYFCFQQ